MRVRRKSETPTPAKTMFAVQAASRGGRRSALAKDWASELSLSLRSPGPDYVEASSLA